MAPSRLGQLRKWSPVGGVVLSGLALFASFYPLAWSELAWFALVPLILVLHYTPQLKRAAQLSYAAGAVFWIGSVFYVSQVTWFGFGLLAAYLGIYLIPFGLFVSWWFRKYSVTVRKRNLLFMWLASGIWVGSEMLRNHLFSGFPMSNLAISQAENVGIIQIADLGGEPLVSFLVIMMNLGIAVTVLRYVVLAGKEKAWPHPELLMAFTLIAAAFCYSVNRYRTVPIEQGRKTVISSVQPNIPQYVKWDETFIEHIYDSVGRLTDLAAAQTNVNLIVWPESAIPHYFPERPAYEFMNSIVTNGVPVLAGLMDFRSVEGALEPSFFNSAIYFNGELRPVARYDKRHLVLMGEYVPFQRFFPGWLNKISPIPESFSAGKESTVFALPDGTPFSSLICFEDMIPGLSRESVQGGARLLINQTNDGWFDPYWANRQRVAQCTFRCIENRVPAVRAANTGVTCSIDVYGRVSVPLAPMTAGLATMVIHIPVEQYQPTLYTRLGDWFGWPMALWTVGFLLYLAFDCKTQPRSLTDIA